MATGFIIGIPLFYNVGFVLMVPLIFSVVYKYKLPAVYIGLPMLASLSVTHGFLPPHPAPAALVGQFHANMGKTLLYGLTVAIPAVIIAGPLFSRTLKGIKSTPLEGLVAPNKPEAQLPGAANSLLTSLLPVILLMLTTLLPLIFPVQVALKPFLVLLGDPSIILLLAIAVATYTLGIRTGRSLKEIMHIYEDAVKDIAMILLIIGGGGGVEEDFFESGGSQGSAGVLFEWACSSVGVGW